MYGENQFNVYRSVCLLHLIHSAEAIVTKFSGLMKPFPCNKCHYSYIGFKGALYTYERDVYIFFTECRHEEYQMRGLDLILILGET